MRARRRFKYWLIADLDGTFLGGPAESQERLNALFGADERDIGLVYCSGRSLAKIYPSVRTGKLPVPSAIIGDVGTGLWDSRGQALSSQFDELVARRWAGAQSRVLPQLRALEGLQLQTGTGPYRCSFVYSKRRTAELAAQRVRKLELDALISGGCYFDVLPRNVNKGFAVRYLLELWRLDPEKVLVAGDTLNDLSMLSLSGKELGVHALAVGNADPELRSHFAVNDRAVYSDGHGAAGIWERLEQLGWVH